MPFAVKEILSLFSALQCQSIYILDKIKIGLFIRLDVTIEDFFRTIK